MSSIYKYRMGKVENERRVKPQGLPRRSAARQRWQSFSRFVLAITVAGLAIIGLAYVILQTGGQIGESVKSTHTSRIQKLKP